MLVARDSFQQTLEAAWRITTQRLPSLCARYCFQMAECCKNSIVTLANEFYFSRSILFILLAQLTCDQGSWSLYDFDLVLKHAKLGILWKTKISNNYKYLWIRSCFYNGDYFEYKFNVILFGTWRVIGDYVFWEGFDKFINILKLWLWNCKCGIKSDGAWRVIWK